MSDKKHGVTGASCHERIFQKAQMSGRLPCTGGVTHLPLPTGRYNFPKLLPLPLPYFFKHFVLSVKTDGDFMMFICQKLTEMCTGAGYKF
jgi:hypothetical protein